ncbi:MAG TPA: M56 family metallopeptidase [Phycisphaerae bacterium]|nr:M56 family metallopeptidase [Phycisphaerae bacterium]HRW55380.1 M56 family metallopeptidase [Phycisphaerae bacterium]
MSEIIEMLRHFDVSDGVWLGLLDATLKATFILLVAVFAVIGLRRAAPRYRHAVLAIAVFGVLVVPVLSNVMPRYRVPLLPEPGGAATQTVAFQSFMPPPTASTPVASDAPDTLTHTATEQLARRISATTLSAPVGRVNVQGDASGSNLIAAPTVVAAASTPAAPHAKGIAANSGAGQPRWGAVNWSVLAVGIWISGIVVGLFWLLLGTFRVNRWLRFGQRVEEADAQRVVRQVSQGLGLRRQIRLIETDAIDSPITWGELRPIVMLPSSWRDWPIDRLRIVLLHELTHVRRHDWLVQMCARLACVVHWFNPLVWFVGRRLEEVRELACDDDVVRIGTRPSTYAETLLDIATRMRRRPMVAAVALNMAARTRLEGRLISILGASAGRHRRGMVFHGVLVVVASSVLLMSAIEPWDNPSARSRKAPADAQTVVSAGRGVQIMTPVADEPDVSQSRAQSASRLADGVRSWSTRFRPAPIPDRSSTASAGHSLTDAVTANGDAALPTTESAASETTRLLDRAAADAQLLWDRAKATYADAEQSVRRSVLKGEFTLASAGVDQAAQIIESARSFAPNAASVDDYRNRVAALRTYVADESRRHDEESIRAKLEEIRHRESTRLAAMADSRRRVVEELMTRAESLNAERRFDEALQALDTLIETDPNHERAIWLRRVIEDASQARRSRAAAATRYHEARTAYIELDEDGIPYGDLIRYPADWPQKSARRQSNEEIRESEETRQARSQLRSRAPEIRFDGLTFEGVVDRIRAMTGLNIVPNWAAMEAVAVERDAEVSLSLTDVTFEKTIELVLSEVGGGEVELGYEIDDGIVRISTKEDLSRRTRFVAYDIRDLIFSVPNFKGPEIDITQAGQNQNQVGGNGGGRFLGNGGGGGLGSGGGSGGSGGSGGTLFVDGGDEDDEADADDAIGPLIDLIQQTIEPDSWREAGGNVGSISALNQQLIVTQTSTAHAQLRDL